MATVKHTTYTPDGRTRSVENIEVPDTMPSEVAELRAEVEALKSRVSTVEQER